MGLRKPHKPSDYPSFILYILDKTHISITAITAASILYTLKAHVLYFSVGALLSSLTAKAIKPLLRTPRPPPPPPSSFIQAPKLRPKKTYGMPSTHSTALSFYFFYLFPIIISSHTTVPVRMLGIAGLVGYWVGGLWSRVELGYHDYAQISAGVGLGFILAGLWRGLWEYGGFKSDLQWLVDVTLGRVFGSL